MASQKRARKLYRHFRDGVATSHILRHAESVSDQREFVGSLIARREQFRDKDLALLRHREVALLRRLADTRRKILIAELACFKDVLSLHDLLTHDDTERD